MSNQYFKMGVFDALRSLYQKINIKIGIHYRLIIAILIIIYIVTIFYMDEKEEEEDLKEYLEIFKHDQEFFRRLYEMPPLARAKYLKVIKKILDNPNNTNSKKVRTLNKIKNGAIFAGITEFLLGASGGIGTLLTSTTRNAFAIGMSGAFT